MSDVINSIFGRSKNDTPNSGGYVAASTTAQSDTIQSDTADVAVTPETVDTKAIEVDQTETVEPTGGATETEDVAADADLVTETVSQDEVVESSTETASAADAVVEPAEAESTDCDQAEDDPENTADTVDAKTIEADNADDQAEDDEIVQGEAVIEIAAEESDKTVTDKDVAEVADEDGGIAEKVESVTVESDDAPVAVAAETDEDDIDQAESVVEPVTAETRPAAGTRGSTTVGDGVVAKIVNMVTRKTEGVHGLDDEGISVEVDGDIATIKVSLVVEFGHAVKALAEQIRINVIEAVEQFLSLDVAVVDVHVTDIHLPDAA
jgi:uncharacterized alkaline shock family protein YloU